MYTAYSPQITKSTSITQEISMAEDIDLHPKNARKLILRKILSLRAFTKIKSLRLEFTPHLTHLPPKKTSLNKSQLQNKCQNISITNFQSKMLQRYFQPNCPKCNLEKIDIRHGIQFIGGSAQIFAQIFANNELHKLSAKSVEFFNISLWHFCEGLQYMKSLRTIKLIGCGINKESTEYIAFLLFQNPNITHLNLSLNFINDEALKVLSKSAAVWSLRYLNLTGNLLTNPGKILSKKILKSYSLRTLILNKNHLKEESIDQIFTALSDNNSLENLDMEFSQIKVSNLEYLSLAIQTNRTLKYLNIGYNLGKSGDLESMKGLFEGIEQGRGIKQLNIQGNQLNLDESMLINNNLGLGYLESINLTECMLGNIGLKVIAKFIQRHFSIVELLLCGNNITDFNDLFLVLSKNISNLRVLDISINYLNVSESSESAFNIFQMLTSNSQLQNIHFGNCEILEITINIIVEALKSNTTLKLLDIQRNKLSLPAITSISDLLMCKIQQLTELNLNYCCIGDFGVSYICDSLIKNSCLAKIILSHNNLTYNSCLSFNKLFTEGEFSYIFHLDLSYNALKDQGVAILVQTIIALEESKRSSLKYIGVRANGVLGAGLCGLPQLVRVSSQLMAFDIRNNMLNGVGHQFIQISKGCRRGNFIQI